MEFNFRAIDENASNYIPRSSNVSYFTEQALRVGYSGSNYGKPATPVNFFQNPHDTREAYQRELEKEMIREEIIAEEIARKRVLEAEVRRELMLERDMTMRRGEGLSFFPGSVASPMPLEPRLPLLPQAVGRQLEERLGMGMSFEERVGYQAQRRRMDGVGTLPFRRNPEPRITEISTLEVKPDGNSSGAKRKAVTAPAVGRSELPSIGFRKKAKEEWSCAICEVSATSQQGLNDHLQGKKHKSKEAALVAQRTGKNYAIGLFPKKPLNPIKKVEITTTTTTQNPQEEKKLEGNLLQIVPVKSDANDIQQSVDLALQVFQNAKESKPESGDSEPIKKNKNGDSEQNQQKKKNPKKFKLWCDMCRVGAFSQKVMNKHREGKKHTARLQECNPNSVTIMTPKVKPLEVITKAEKEGHSDNLNRAVNAKSVETHLSAA